MSNSTLTNTIVSECDAANLGRFAGETLCALNKEALHASVSVLPVAARQLHEVAKHVEESVVKVCESFQGMIQLARQATAQVTRIEDSKGEEAGKGKVGLNHLVSETRETLEDLLGRITHTSDFSSQMVDRLNNIEKNIAGLEETLGDIDQVANKSGLLALNGQLEAARAGEQGAAFAIVATETAKMAVQAVASSKKIRKMIGSISQNISGASSELKDRAASDIQATSLSRNEVNRTLDDMSSLHGEMQKTIEQSSDNSQRLAKDISSAVMAMQFQDAVSQRIEHVVHLLMDVHDSLKQQLGDNTPDSPPPEEMATIDWTSRMAKSYTMASEHQVLAGHRNSKAGPSPDLGDNVELF